MHIQDVTRLVVDRPDEGLFSVHRDIFRDEQVFDLEMRHIFESTWVFLGLASQAPLPHDFFTGWVGRQPVVVSRDATGKLGCFINSCRHRGAVIAHPRAGNARYHVCHYHGWAYDSGGRCIDIKDQQAGCYPPGFDKADHNLIAVPRFGEYRGLLFASLGAGAPSLQEYLGETRPFLDLIVDQSEHGVELVPGGSSYIYRGNWKLQLENCVDLYHLTSAHPSFMKIVERRKSGESRHGLKALDFNDYRLPGVVRGSYTFKHGHAMVWGATAAPEVRPLYSDIDNLRRRVGDLRAQWMLATRNLTLFPNVQFAENASLQLRVMRPLAVDRTEMQIYCLAPVGEADAAREHRIRQYEDFFNSTGLATPDDTASYEDCQTGYRARHLDWQQGYQRGITALVQGPDKYAAELGSCPATSLSGHYDIQDETVFHAGYREWLRLMQAGFARDAGRGHEGRPGREAAVTAKTAAA